MYEPLKGALLRLLKMPAGPPDPPPGAQGNVRVFRASKKYLWFQMIGMGFAALIFVVVDGIASLGALASREPVAAIVPIAILVIFGSVFVLRYFIIRLEYEMRYYLVTDRSLRIRAGVMMMTEVTLTYANVQAININQNFIQRWLGISDLIVQTAGGGAPAPGGHGGQSMAHRGVLRGIDNPEQMRDEIMALVRQFRDAGLGDPEDVKRAGADVRLERLREIRDELRVLRQRLS